MTVDFESATQKARAHAERGTELFFEEKYQDAAGELLLAIKASPEPFIEAERLLAHAYRLSIETPEQLARTIGQFEKVVSLDSSDVGSWCWLALLAQAASLTQQQIADATRQGWIQSGSTGTVSAIRQISRDSRIRKQANKFQQIASRASVQAWQGFAGLDPEQAAGDEILYALESAVTLADFYREEAGAPSTA
ncbi:MAG: hypothetical protein H5T62_17475, partial [Anaerolineae bacterium]|nr:hypothetical protein [Anaerolineae bacterium]